MSRIWQPASYFRLLVTAFVSSAWTVAAEQGKELSLDQTLAEAQFNTGHMPLESMLVSKYGEGHVYVQEGDIYHVYYLADSHLWLRCKSMGDDKRYKPISEILVSSVDLGGKRITPRAPVIAPHLKGLRVGDAIDKALVQWGEPLRQYSKKLGSKTTTVFEFFPTSLVEGSCVRFFVQDGTILGFSFSTEE